MAVGCYQLSLCKIHMLCSTVLLLPMGMFMYANVCLFKRTRATSCEFTDIQGWQGFLRYILTVDVVPSTRVTRKDAFPIVVFLFSIQVIGLFEREVSTRWKCLRFFCPRPFSSNFYCERWGFRNFVIHLQKDNEMARKIHDKKNDQTHLALILTRRYKPIPQS